MALDAYRAGFLETAADCFDDPLSREAADYLHLRSGEIDIDTRDIIMRSRISFARITANTDFADFDSSTMVLVPAYSHFRSQVLSCLDTDFKEVKDKIKHHDRYHHAFSERFSVLLSPVEGDDETKRTARAHIKAALDDAGVIIESAAHACEIAIRDYTNLCVL